MHFEALVVAVADRRDRDAFARLFSHFVPRLTAYLLRLGTDSGTAEDIAQETMVTLWRKAEKFDPERSSLGTWLFRIAYNRRVDRLRSNRLHLLDPTDPVMESVDDTDALVLLQTQEREAAVRSALKDLPDEQLLVIHLAFFHGFSHSEVAKRLELPLGTVKSRIRLGVTRLRQTLQAGGCHWFD